jgi:hypothetical protein
MTSSRTDTGPLRRLVVRCPRCRLRLGPLAPVLVPQYCPRCLAKQRLTVELQPISRRGDRVTPAG